MATNLSDENPDNDDFFHLIIISIVVKIFQALIFHFALKSWS